VSVPQYKPCHIPLKYGRLIKKSGHIRPHDMGGYILPCIASEDILLKCCLIWFNAWVLVMNDQRKEWVVHKHECEVLVRLLKEKQRRPTSTLRMVLRLLIKRRLQADKVGR
jgi:hypothetical protein